MFLMSFKKNDVSQEIFENIFLGGPYGDFSDIKSSIRNRMDDFNYFLSENAANSNGLLADF